MHNMHESQRKGTSPFPPSLHGQHLHLSVTKSRTPPVPQPQLGAMAKAKLAELGKLGKLDAAHLKEDRNWQWHSSFPVPHLMVDIGVIIRCLGYFRIVNAMKGLLMKCLWELFVYLGMHLKPKFGDVQ